jgi:hypothetical protein
MSVLVRSLESKLPDGVDVAGKEGLDPSSKTPVEGELEGQFCGLPPATELPGRSKDDSDPVDLGPIGFILNRS